jgi:hypothetical protein
MARIQSDVINKAYDYQGVERCDALNAQDFGWRMEMSKPSLAAMDAFVGGFRMREWKPENDQLTNPQYKYCYLYDSKNSHEDLRDRALNANNGAVTCDAFKSYTRNPEFITRAFIDETPDKTHTMTYRKCVLEIDPKKVTASNLDTFWKTVGENECTELYRKNTQNLTNLKDAFTQCNNLNTYYKRSAPAYTKCVTQCNALIDSFSKNNQQYIHSNCDFYGFVQQETQCDIAGTSNDLMTELNALRFVYAQSNAHLKTKQQDLKSLNARVAGMQRREQELGTYKKTLQADLQRCSNIDIPQTQNEIKLLAQRELDVNSNIRQITDMLGSCRSNLVTARASWLSLSNETAILKAANDQMERDAFMCKVDVEALREKITTHKADVGKYGSLLQQCRAEFTTLKAKNQGMSNLVAKLTWERDDWIRRCAIKQADQFKDNTTMVASYAKAGVKLGNDLCGSADPLAADIAKMVRVRDAIVRSMTEMQNSPCPASFKRACCR